MTADESILRFVSFLFRFSDEHIITFMPSSVLPNGENRRGYGSNLITGSCGSEVWSECDIIFETTVIYYTHILIYIVSECGVYAFLVFFFIFLLITLGPAQLSRKCFSSAKFINNNKWEIKTHLLGEQVADNPDLLSRWQLWYAAFLFRHLFEVSW